jgi:hypothetical protein
MWNAHEVSNRMSDFRPTIAEERWRVLAQRYPSLQSLARDAAQAGPWKYATLLTRCLFFVLGLFAASLAYGVIRLLGFPVAGLVTGLVLIGVAEWLIRTRHLFASGIEESLWSVGAAMLAYELFRQLLSGSDATGVLLMATALALAGWRLLNPLLTTVAAVLVSLWLAILVGRGWSLAHFEDAGYACFAIGFIALAAGAWRFQRPSYDYMVDGLVVVMPAIGYVWLTVNRNGPLTLQTLGEGDLPPLLPLLLVVAFGCIALLTGLRRRTHAPLIALLACVPMLAYELRALTGLALQWRLILWGSIGLLVAIVLERALRGARAGITSLHLEESGTALELAQLGSAAIATPSIGASGAAPAPDVEGQGGGFGGGGASGRY